MNKKIVITFTDDGKCQNIHTKIDNATNIDLLGFINRVKIQIEYDTLIEEKTKRKIEDDKEKA